MVTWDDWKDTRKQADVVRFLTELGYQRSTKQFSIDHKNGLVKKNDKGIFTRRAVHQYANAFLVRGANADKSPAVGETRKLQLQCQKLERENEEGSFKFAVLKGRYIPRNELYIQLAGRAAILDSGVEQFIRAKSSEFIAIVNGDQGKSPDFVDLFISEWKDLLHHYATTKDFDVIFKGEKIEDEPGLIEAEDDGDD